MRRPSPENSPPIDQPEQRFEQYRELSSEPDVPSQVDRARILESGMKDRITQRLREGQELTLYERAFLVEDLVRNRDASELGRMNFTRHGFKNARDAMRRLDVRQVTVPSEEPDEKGNQQVEIYDRGRENFWQRMPAWSRRMMTQGGVSGAVTLGGLAIGGLAAGPAALVALGAWGGGLVGSGIVEAIRHRHLHRDRGGNRSLAYRSAEAMFQNLEDAIQQGRGLEEAETDEDRAEVINNVVRQIHSNEIESLRQYRRADNVYKVARVLASAAGAGLGGWATQMATLQQSVLARGAEGIHDLDLDGDGVSHTVKRFTDGYHFQIKQEDILEAARLQQQMGASAAPFNAIGEAGSSAAIPTTLGQEAIYHAGTLDMNLINSLIQDGVLQETGKAIAIAAGASAGTAFLQEAIGGWRNRVSGRDQATAARLEELSPARGRNSNRTDEDIDNSDSGHDEERRVRETNEIDDTPMRYEITEANAASLLPVEQEVSAFGGQELHWVMPTVPEASVRGLQSRVTARNQEEEDAILQQFHAAYQEHIRIYPGQPFPVEFIIDTGETERRQDGTLYYTIHYNLHP